MEKIKDLTNSFATMRLVTFGSLFVTVLTIIAAGLLVVHAYGSVGQRVYVVGTTGTTLMALADSPENHTEYEMRVMIRQFAEKMYAHDQYTYKTNMDQALPLIDAMGGRRLYTDFKKQDLEGNYVKFGARTMVNVDSIILDTSKLPITGKLYMRQKGYIGDRQSASLPLGCSFELTNTHRSNANPFGLMITRFDYFPYHPEASDKEKQTLLAQQERDRAELQRVKEQAEAAKKAQQ